MNIKILFIFEIILVVLAMLHSLSRRGVKFTGAFFFWAFLWTLLKEKHMGEAIRAGGTAMTSLPYEILNSGGRPLMAALIPTLGWVLSFYLCWAIAEMILARFIHFRKVFFLNLFFSVLIVASMAYAVEATALHAGWWRWRAVDTRFSNFLVGCPFHALEAWTGFGIPFLATFFLFTSTKLKDHPRKYLLFFIPAIHFLGASVYAISPLPSIIIAKTYFFSAAVFSFYPGFKVDYGPKTGSRALPAKAVLSLPLLIFGFILLVTAVVDLLVIKEKILFISLVPGILFIFMAIAEIPLSYLLVLSGALVIAGKERLVIAVLPVLFLWVMSIYEKFIYGRVRDGKA